MARDKATRRVRKHSRARKSGRGTNRFNQRELSRAIKAVTRAGATLDHVEVDPATGRIIVILAKPSEAENAAGAKAWNDATEAIVRKFKSAPTRR